MGRDESGGMVNIVSFAEAVTQPRHQIELCSDNPLVRASLLMRPRLVIFGEHSVFLRNLAGDSVSKPVKNRALKALSLISHHDK
jgi:hypothetical protein